MSPKKSDGEEKYDPLEADVAESEEEENREAEEEEEHAKETTTGNATNAQDPKTSVDEIWTDMDNDNDVEMGNLIDETDEKEHVEEKSVQKAERNHSPQVKRGRGYGRGRGGPRARRSRR
jgi:hypothetical protein